MHVVCDEQTPTYLGEWLNGRAAVSKTAGCVFESRLPCHIFAKSITMLFAIFIQKENFMRFLAFSLVLFIGLIIVFAAIWLMIINFQLMIEKNKQKTKDLFLKAIISMKT